MGWDLGNGRAGEGGWGGGVTVIVDKGGSS